MSDQHSEHPNRYVRAILAMVGDDRSLYAFSKKSGVAESTIRSWRDMGTGPSTRTIRRICNGLGMTEEELLAKSDSVDTVNTPIVRVSVQVGDNSVENSQLILRAFRNVAAEQARLAAAMTQLNAGLSDLGLALEKAVEVEKREHVPDPATTRKATGTNGTR